MSQFKANFHVRSSTGYDDLTLNSDASTSVFNPTGSALTATITEIAIKEVQSNVENVSSVANSALSTANTALQPSNINNNLTTTTSGFTLDARQGKVLDDKISLKTNEISSFTTAGSFANIVSGETVSTIFGKLSNWFNSFKQGAFNDVANLLTIVNSGSVLDARQGKVLDDKITQVSTNLSDTTTTLNNTITSSIAECGKYTQIFSSSGIGGNTVYTTSDFTGAKALAFRVSIGGGFYGWCTVPNIIGISGNAGRYNTSTENYNLSFSVENVTNQIRTLGFIRSSGWSSYNIGLTVYKIM